MSTRTEKAYATRLVRLSEVRLAHELDYERTGNGSQVRITRATSSLQWARAVRQNLNTMSVHDAYEQADSLAAVPS